MILLYSKQGKNIITNEVSMLEYKETFLKRVITKIKNIFDIL